MKVIQTQIPGVKIIEPKVFNDARGYFFESFKEKDFIREVANVHFVQDNESLSEGNVLRGLHFQTGEYAQAKLVRVVEGKVLDVAVDLRLGSKTFGQHVAVELSGDNHRQLFIPRGFAHGFAALSPKVKFQYKCDNYYCPHAEAGIAFNDPELNIDWIIDTDIAIISDKDKKHPTLKEWLTNDRKKDFSYRLKRILVTGANGQLGCCLRRAAEARNEEFLFTDIDELDITSKEELERTISSFKPEVIINCAAYTAVDNAESNVQTARCLNVQAPELLAQIAKQHNALLVHVSTDYVFGNSLLNKPIDESTATAPLGVYGKTKLEGENKIINSGCRYIIVRTAWLYSEFGHNFVKTMLSLMREQKPLKVVDDQTGTPTYAGDLAKALLLLIDKDKQNEIYHFSNLGTATWYDFAKAIKQISKLSESKLTPCSTEEYPTPATRPAYSVLSKKKFIQHTGMEIPYWLDSLTACIRNLMNND